MPKEKEELSKEVKLVTECPLCGQIFKSSKLFRIHWFKQHATSHARTSGEISWKADETQIDAVQFEKPPEE